MRNDEAGRQEKQWYRLTGLSTIILFLIGVLLFIGLLPMIAGA